MHVARRVNGSRENSEKDAVNTALMIDEEARSTPPSTLPLHPNLHPPPPYTRPFLNHNVPCASKSIIWFIEPFKGIV